MSEKIFIKIVTPDKTVFDGEVESITLPTKDGQITILPHHMSYITVVAPGEVIVRHNGKETMMSISGGFIEFNKNQLVVLADTAERAADIDLARAEEARKRAEELKKESVLMDEAEYARVVSAVEKELARVRVAKKHRTKHGTHLE